MPRPGCYGHHLPLATTRRCKSAGGTALKRPQSAAHSGRKSHDLYKRGGNHASYQARRTADGIADRLRAAHEVLHPLDLGARLAKVSVHLGEQLPRVPGELFSLASQLSRRSEQVGDRAHQGDDHERRHNADANSHGIGGRQELVRHCLGSLCARAHPEQFP